MKKKLLGPSLMVVLLFMAVSSSTQAKPLSQLDDPAAQCSFGMLSLISSDLTQARTRLSAGFYALKDDPAADKDTVMTCGMFLGMLYMAESDWNGALAVYELVLPISRVQGDRQTEFTMLYGIGSIYMAQSRYAEAEEKLREALPLTNQADDWFSAELRSQAKVATLNNIGVVIAALETVDKDVNLRDYEEARTWFNKALALGQQKSQPAQLAPEELLGQILKELLAPPLDEEPQSTENMVMDLLFNQVLEELFKGAIPSFEPIILNNIGQSYSEEKQYAKALEYFTQAIHLTEDLTNQTGFTSPTSAYNQIFAGIIYHNMGLVYYRQGEGTLALPYFAQALAIMQELKQPLGEANVLAHLGFVKEQQAQQAEKEGDLERAINKILEAQAHYEAAMDSLESVQFIVDNSLVNIVNEGELGTSSTFAFAGSLVSHRDVYDFATRSYYQAGVLATQNQPSRLNEQEMYKKAFYTSERGRARLFLNLLASNRLRLADDEEAVRLLGQEQKAYVDLVAARRELRIIGTLASATPATLTNLERQLAEAETKHEAVWEIIKARNDKLITLTSAESNILDLTEVQLLLDEQTTLVSYYAFSDEGLLAFIITKNNFTVVALPDITQLQIRQQLTNWRNSFRIDEANLKEAHPQQLQKLYTWLIKPLVNYIPTPKLGLIPHQYLHYIPFAGLTDGQTYLSEKYTLFTLPSASTLPILKQNSKTTLSRGSALVLGNPTSSNETLGSLPLAIDEATQVADILQSSAYLGHAATEKLIQTEASAASVIHIAAHSIYNLSAPLNSAIYLAPDNDDDGNLQVRDIFDLKLPKATLVALSACETNIGQTSTQALKHFSGGDEIVSLTRSFFYAGTPTVLSSLWQVNDKSTGILMITFYEKWWQDGLTKAEALQAAQEKVRQQNGYQNPHYWAGFVLGGYPE